MSESKYEKGKTMKREFGFGCIDYAGRGTAKNRVMVEMEYNEKGGKKRFSVCANVWNSRHSDIVRGGQCLDTIAPYIKDPVYSEILRLWELYHLNDMHPECEHQAAQGWREKAGEKVTLYEFVLKTEIITQEYDIEKKILKAIKKDGYVEIPEGERKILNLDFSITSYLDFLPEDIASFYKLEKTKEKTLGTLTKEEHPEGLLSKACPVCGYKYGHSWNYFPIPAEDEAIILKLLEEGGL